MHLALDVQYGWQAAIFRPTPVPVARIFAPVVDHVFRDRCETGRCHRI